MSAYYNEHDPFAAAWLRELIAEGLITPGVVDERDIQIVQPADLAGFTRCHFFAGIGGWDYALQLAGWGDRPVWTGSCPCQPYSGAGKGEGADDARNLWPSWFRLIRECRPPAIFGEQVEAAIRHGWLDAVSTDLEAEGYAFGSAVLGAHSVGAPHIRQRVWFVAESGSAERGPGGAGRGREVGGGPPPEPSGSSDASLVADTDGGEADAADPRGLHAEPRTRRDPRAMADESSAGQLRAEQPQDHRTSRDRGSADDAESGGEGLRADAGGLADADGRESSDRDVQRGGQHGQQPEDGGVGLVADTERGAAERRRLDVGEAPGSPESGAQERERLRADAGAGGGPWSDLVWLPCRDGKARPTQPGIQPLAHGISNRMGTLRGAGNAIVPQVGAAFIESYMMSVIPPIPGGEV